MTRLRTLRRQLHLALEPMDVAEFLAWDAPPGNR